MRKNAKESIAQAFIALMSKKAVEKIRIKELIENAEVSKAAYYYHFQDLDDVARYVIEKFSEKFKETLDHAESMEDVQFGSLKLHLLNVQLYEYIYMNRIAFKNLLESSYRQMFIESLVRTLIDVIMKNRYSYKDGSQVITNNRARKRYYAYAVAWKAIGYVLCWVEDDFEFDAKELTDLLFDLELNPPTYIQSKESIL